MAEDVAPGDSERGQSAHSGTRLGVQDLRRARPLHGDERRGERAIVERRVVPERPQDVRAVLRDVRRVHDHEEFRLAGAIHDHVVHDRAALVAEEAVARLADRESGDVARDEALDVRPRAFPGEKEFAHVREVEEARARPHGPVLDDDAVVLDRHLVSGERDHLRAERDVPVIERGAPEGRRLGRHQAASLAAARARSRMSR